MSVDHTRKTFINIALKALKLALLTLICFMFTAGFKPVKAPMDNFAATVKRLQKEVGLIQY